MAPKAVADCRLDWQPNTGQPLPSGLVQTEQGHRGVQTSKQQLLDEARSCRRQAVAFIGKPEAPFLLNVAGAFERLATAPAEPGDMIIEAVRA